MDIRKTGRIINQWVGNYLTYNRTEQRGIFVLNLILFGVITANVVIPSETFQKPPDFSAFSKEVSEFEAAWKRATDSGNMVHTRKYPGIKNSSGTYSHDTLKLFSSKPVLKIELNSADTFELQQLRGIGPSFARRIVIYRQRLRGFYDKKQLLEIPGMDTARYAMIESNLTVNHDSIHPIDLNTVTFKELLHHPYFPFPVTKNIMIYRLKNKNFKTLGELRNIQGVNDSLYRRMVIYLRIGP